MSEPTMTSQTGWRLVGAAALTAAGAGLLLTGGHHLLTLLPARGIDALVTVFVLGAGIAVLTWYVLSGAVALICLTIRSAGLVWAGGELLVRRRGAPAVRRLLGGGAGAMLVAGSLLGPASAGGPEEDPDPVSLTWSPSLDATPELGPAEDPRRGGTAPDEHVPEDEPDDDHEALQTDPDPVPGTEAEPDATETTPEAAHTVRAGDTLWSLAAAALGERATDAQIAAHWPQWYQANEGVIGTDPDLIVPGQVLTHPEGSTS